MADTPYEILGQDGVKALASAFYDVMDELPDAADIRAMHAECLDDIKRLLTAYLTGWLGGPPVYEAMTGTVCLTDPHAPFAIGVKERDQWLDCMHRALDRIEASDELKEMLEIPLFRIADTVRNCEDSSQVSGTRHDPNIRSAALSTLKWCDMEGFEISNASARSPALHEPAASRFRISRRVGSESALKTC
jgi:hemoglobin